MDNEAQAPLQPKKTLAEIEREELAAFDQFMFIIWQPNPARQTVKVRLDDGEVALTLKNEKFLYMVENVLLDGCTREIYNNAKRIELSLQNYGQTYFYDRSNNIFKELSRVDSLEKINMKDVFNSERKKLGSRDDLKESVIKNLEDKIATQDRKATERDMLKDFLHNNVKTFASLR